MNFFFAKERECRREKKNKNLSLHVQNEFLCQKKKHRKDSGQAPAG